MHADGTTAHLPSSRRVRCRPLQPELNINSPPPHSPPPFFPVPAPLLLDPPKTILRTPPLRLRRHRTRSMAHTLTPAPTRRDTYRSGCRRGAVSMSEGRGCDLKTITAEMRARRRPSAPTVSAPIPVPQQNGTERNETRSPKRLNAFRTPGKVGGKSREMAWGCVPAESERVRIGCRRERKAKTGGDRWGRGEEGA